MIHLSGLSVSNDFIVLAFRDAKVSRNNQGFLTTKIVLKLPIPFAKMHDKYELVLHRDGGGVDLSYPRVPAIDQDGVASMCKDDHSNQTGEHKLTVEQMENQYKAVFTYIRTAGSKIIAKKSYRFADGALCSPEFYNKDPSVRTLDPLVTVSKLVVYHDAASKKDLIQTVSFLNWQLSVVHDTRPLAEMESQASVDPLARAFASQSLDDDTEMNG